MLVRQQILAKTLYGTDIYSHFLRQHYPGEVVMTVKGRDCGLCRNPFDGDRPTLHIWREKIHPERKLSDEISFHHDLSGAIPDGDCFDFAERCTGLQNQALLEYINRELYLHIGEQHGQYTKTKPESIQELPEDLPEATQDLPKTPAPATQQPRISFFRRPVYNKTPEKEMTLKEVYDYLVGDTAKTATERLRSIADEDARKKFKATSFDYITPAGTFRKRDSRELIAPSGYMVIDIDHLNGPEEVESTFQTLLSNGRLETLLLFRSPSGNGLKWIIPIVNNEGHDHEFYFRAVTNYLKSFGIIVDQSGKDISRACFLPHDSAAYINPKCI